MSCVAKQKMQAWFALVVDLLSSFVLFFVFLMLPPADLHVTLDSQKHTLLHSGECSSLLCCFGLTG